MREDKGVRLYSATDLVNFLGCQHSTVLDMRQLSDPVEFPPDVEQTVLLQEKGIEHEKAYLESLRAHGLSIVEIAPEGSLNARVERTYQAMRDGVDVVYQGALFSAPWHGFSDFLLRVNGVPSNLGDFAYDVADTKLARSAKPKHVLQLCVYAGLLARVLGSEPLQMHVVLGDGGQASLRTADFRHYYGVALKRFEAFVTGTPPTTVAEPCAHCTFCRWAPTCEAEWEAAEHLSLVARMTRGQIDKLTIAGIHTLRQLAEAPDGSRVANLQADTFARLKSQAALQLVQRETGENHLELLPIVAGRGFSRLPRPDVGDLFFDMEGDPLFEGGLEYLFGLVHAEGSEELFSAFWAHDRDQEKTTFEQTIDFMVARLAKFPDAHIYHYAAYEESALKRLAMYHGTREAEVDNMLRGGKLVDLYKVVREALRVSEPRYSIKNLEHFYLEGGRTGGVKTAGDSVVMYERWRRLADDNLLGEIAAYNELDCRSTSRCRDWLLTLRPNTASWFVAGAAEAPSPDKEQKRLEAERRTAALIIALIGDAKPTDRPWRELLGHLLEFHRREAKPSWWAMFARQEMSEGDLIDDTECIGGLRPDATRPPRLDKKSTVYSFTFPPQDFKMGIGDEPVRAGTLEPAGEIVNLDDETARISLKLGPSRSPLGQAASLIPKGPIGDKVLRDAIYRYAEAVARGEATRYAALNDILQKTPPRLHGNSPGAAIIPIGSELVQASIDALKRLSQSYMLIQGPPGAGKTFTSSQAIVELLAAGKTVGIASNSHKAINNLLVSVETIAREERVIFRGVKKSSTEDQFLPGARFIENTMDNDRATGGGFDLIAGTAWLFAREKLDGALDYLFVDEAGQVSLANIVAMGVSAKNIVLVGDQMQLAQPVQGVHPGDSGKSGLQHLLGDRATVPPDRGIFLPTTRRMHPDICRFISDAVYDGRLTADVSASNQRLNFEASPDPAAVAPTGIRFVTVEHSGCAQRSEPEAERLTRCYEALLGTAWIDHNGQDRQIGHDDILVVSPYNMQVNLLRARLPIGARVGTVDKFQGQEAAIVLISFATSSGEDLPRQIEFLYSRNRLNVAISRARCLAVIFASPRLLEIPCATIEQMRLVNTLCWAKGYSDSAVHKH
jgi:uncharacterized protein